MGQPVVHFEIAGIDEKALQQFYADLFGWKIDATNPMNYGMVDTDAGGAGIGGGIFKAPKDVPFLTIYVAVDDLQAYLDKAVSLGGQAVVPPTVIPGYGSFAFLKDPEGNIVGLFRRGE